MNTSLSQRGDKEQIASLYSDPFRTFESRMNHLFRNMFDGSGFDSDLSNYPVDVDEDEDQITIEAELPGFKSDEIDIRVENGVLTIQAERQAKQEADQGKKQHLRERRHTRIQRSFTLPRSVDGSDVEASLSDGVLSLVLKKLEKSKARQITIKSK